VQHEDEERENGDKVALRPILGMFYALMDALKVRFESNGGDRNRVTTRVADSRANHTFVLEGRDQIPYIVVFRTGSVLGSSREAGAGFRCVSNGRMRLEPRKFGYFGRRKVCFDREE
jgi:hypothetical protein